MLAAENSLVVTVAGIHSDKVDGAIGSEQRREVAAVGFVTPTVNPDCLWEVRSDVSRSRRDGQNAKECNQYQHQRESSLETSHAKVFNVTHVSENTSFIGR